MQCGSDIQVHRLLQDVHEELEEVKMKNEIAATEEKSVKTSSRPFMVFQIIPSILLLICTVFGIFIGIRFLLFLEHAESRRVSISDKWSETGFEQLQQMNATIKQELDLILDQRREIQTLRSQLEEVKKIPEKIQGDKNNEI